MRRQWVVGIERGRARQLELVVRALDSLGIRLSSSVEASGPTEKGERRGDGTPDFG
jgi:hypothetical protein